MASLTLKELIKEYYKQWSGAEDGKCGMSSNPRAQRIDQHICDVLGDERTEEWVNIYSGDGFGKKLFKKYDEIDQQLRDNGVSDRPIIKFARIVCEKFFEWLDAHYDENMNPKGSLKEDAKKDFATKKRNATNIILKFCLDNNFKTHDWGLIGLTSYRPDSRELAFEFFISDSKGILEDLSDSEAKAFIKDWFKAAGIKVHCYEITYDDYRRFYFEGSYGKLKNVSEGYRRNRYNNPDMNNDTIVFNNPRFDGAERELGAESLFDRILFESNVEIYPENGKLKMTAITPQLMSNRTVNKSTPLEMQDMTHKPSDSTVKTARAVVSLLKDNDAIDEIGNEFDISNGPDMTIMGDGSVKVTPDKGSGKPAHKISKQAIDNKLKTM